MMFAVYVIKSKRTDKIYIGHTESLEERLKRHNGDLSSKKTSYTSRNSGPWYLIYKEEYKTREEARKREKQLKSYQGRRWIKEYLLGPVAQR